jgi:tRNA-dihydrouridine synthase B
LRVGRMLHFKVFRVDGRAFHNTGKMSDATFSYRRNAANQVFYHPMLKIGSLTLSVPFIQAPLSGYSDMAMRRLALDFGAPLTFCGVVLAQSAANPRVMRKLAFRPYDNEHPVGAQLLGSEPDMMVKAAVAMQQAGFDIIDLNFACPAPKVLRRCRGGYMLNEPQKVLEIYDRVRDAVTCPLTMKLRTGYDAGSESYDNFYTIVSGAAARKIDAVTIHNRRVLHKFTGQADYEVLAEIKRSFPEMVLIGSGDNFAPETIIERIKKHKLDGAMIARGAVGNPWIYKNLNAVWAGQPVPAPPNLAEQADVILRHFDMEFQLYGPKRSIGHFRKFLVQYCRLHPLRRRVQRDVIAANNSDELTASIKKWYLDGQNT